MTRTTTKTVLDPICGMTIDPATAAGSATFNGETYHFCSRSCEVKFDAAPAQYARSSAAPAQGASCCATGSACC